MSPRTLSSDGENRATIVVWVRMMCVLAMPDAMAAHGYFAHGYGTKNKGMSGVGVALPQDTIAAATNPAGMVHLGERLDAGLAIFSPRRDYETRQMAQEARSRLVPMTSAATAIVSRFLMSDTTIRSMRKVHWESRCMRMGE